MSKVRDSIEDLRSIATVDDAQTYTADQSHADNVKAKFGASDDLQIYHDGSHSYVTDTGTGSLLLCGSNLALKNGAGTENFLVAAENGAVYIYNDNNQKLSTTSTGVDVTGTVTADGLVVDANTATFSAGTSGNMEVVIQADTDNNDEGDSPSLVFKQDGGNTVGRIGLIGNDNDVFTGSIANALYIGNDEYANLQFYTNLKERVLISNTGDISFYEDTGTTPKFFWDASAESLGIGTSSPSAKLELSSNNSAGTPLNVLRFNDEDGTQAVGQATGRIEFYHNDSSVGAGVASSITNKSQGSTALGELHLATGSDTTAMVINSLGNVGIGTSSPSAKITIVGTTKVGEGVASNTSKLMVNTLSGTAAGIQLFQDGVESWIIDNPASSTALAFSNSGTERIRIDSSGNVGIGTSSPAAPLTVSGDTTQVRLENTATGGRNWGLRTFGSALGIYDHTAGAFRQYIDSSGNVGIGTVSPTELLTVNGSIALQYNSSDRVKLSYTNAQGSFVINNTTAGYTSFENNGSERLRIDSAGNVGIGTSSPSRPLTVSKAGEQILGEFINTTASQTARLYVTCGTQTAQIQQLGNTHATDPNTLRLNTTSGDITFAPSSVERMRIESSGNVGINNSSPSAKLHISHSGGDVQAILERTGSSQGWGGIGGNVANAFHVYNSSYGKVFQVSQSDGSIQFPTGSSGGVYLGGTGAANKLDDYEEGTWTPNVSGDATGVLESTTVGGYYTKVGNQVTLYFNFRVTTNFSGSFVGGLPFQVDYGSMSSSWVTGGVVLGGASNTVSAGLQNGTSKVRLFNNNQLGDTHDPNTTMDYYRFQLSYRTGS